MSTTASRRKSSSKSSTKRVKRCYSFGSSRTDGDGSMKTLLGGKGANLAEMTSIGLPVPPGFTITTGLRVVGFRRGNGGPRVTSVPVSRWRWWSRGS